MWEDLAWAGVRLQVRDQKTSWVFTDEVTADEHHHVDLCAEISVEKTEILTKSPKKKKKKKKKNRSDSMDSMGSCSGSRLSWGNVEEIFFTRGIAYNSIPNNGGYPLGLDQEEGRQMWAIDDYFSQQQSELILRSQKLGLDISHVSNEGAKTMPPLETRQHDFKAGSNPLFRPLSEDERYIVLLSLLLVYIILI
jgi:hypothetical protein